MENLEIQKIKEYQTKEFEKYEKYIPELKSFFKELNGSNMKELDNEIKKLKSKIVTK
jgi:hypothetical protein